VKQPSPFARGGRSDGFDELGAEFERPEADLRLLLMRGVKRSWGWIAVLVLAGATIGLVVGLARPNSYASDAKLLLRVGTREQVTSETLVGLDGERRNSLPTVNDELQMLADASIFESIARQIGPAEILVPADPGRNDGPETSAPTAAMHSVQRWFTRAAGPPHECEGSGCEECVRLATKALVENTKVTNDTGSNVIQVKSVSSSPERARRVVQALTEAFVERHRRQFSMQAIVDASRAKVDEARRARDEAEDAWAKHLTENGALDVEPQLLDLQKQVAEVEAELFTARTRRKAIARQRDLLAGRLEDVPPDLALSAAAVLIPNEEYSTQLELRKELMLRKHEIAISTPAMSSSEIHRREEIVDAQIAEVEQHLREMPRELAREGSSAGAPLLPNPRFQRAEDLEFEDADLSVRVEELAIRLMQKQTQLAEIGNQWVAETIRRGDVVAEREAAVERYNKLLERFTQLQALAAIDLQEDPNLRVLQAPTLDLKSVGPKRVALLLAGLIVGLFAGLAVALLRQRFDRTLRHPDAIEIAHGIPVIGVVPRLPSWRNLARRPMARTN
jgi:uncharacterized protein involved in exopolysaccharide biosynthesis